MLMLGEMRLVKASVDETATFLHAARALFAARIAALAVLDGDQRVVGMFTDDDLLRGVFPGYLLDLHHTAFLEEASGALAATLDKARGDPVRQFMREPMSVDIESSAAHVAERFLHCPWGALAVVANERFVGMLEQVQFVEALMSRIGGAGD
jgi:CBS-domain-containing membrane protein